MEQDIHGLQRWVIVRLTHFVDLLRKDNSRDSFMTILNAIIRVAETAQRMSEQLAVKNK